MRESWRALKLLVLTSVRSEPGRAAATLLEPLSRLAYPLFAIWLKLLTDGVVQQNTTYLVTGVAGIALVSTGLFLASIVGTDMRVRLSEHMGLVFDREVARLVAVIPGLEHLERPDYRDRLELLRRSQRELGDSLNSLLNVLNAVVGAVGTLVVLAFLNPWLLLLVFFALPAIPLARLQQRWQRRAEEVSATPDRQARHLRDLTTDRNAGMELRVFRLQEEIRRRYRRAADTARRALLAAERRIGWTDAARQVVFAIGYVTAIGFVLHRAVQGRATAGDVVAAAYICQQVAQAVVWPIFSVARLGKILRAAGRLLWLRDYAEETAARHAGTIAPPERLRDGVVLENVSFTYPGTDRPVLKDVSLTLPAGSVIALVGENGAGKTTLVKLLTRMYEPTEGRILVDGVDLADLETAVWRSRTTAAFQDFAKPELTAGRAVGIGDLERLDDRSAVLDGLRHACAEDVLEALPDGTDTQLGSTWEGGVDLSTGQWQKLALGRAFLRDDPLMVFFDEPTASLDAQTEDAIFKRYAAAARAGCAAGAITVLVSHRFSTVRSAGRILVLDDGRGVELGSHEELLEDDGLYAQLYSLQAEAYAPAGGR